jgi:Zn-dependent protease
MPQYFPNLTIVQYWIMGSIGAIILFISVLLHELMHSVVALRYGIKVRQIILFIFGGVSEITEETRDFRKEFKIAIAGPAASFAILPRPGGLYLKLLLQSSSYWSQNK